MTSIWAGLGFSADGAIEALSATSIQVVESYARARVEVARSEFRQGEVDSGIGALQGMIARLRPVTTADATTDGLDLVRAIANSVYGQGLEQMGDLESARSSFGESVERFRGVDDAMLNPRDHGDFGVALAALGVEDEALDHLRRSREAGGATPEAARHHATLLQRGGKTQVAEELLREALLTSPADPDALRALGMIQAQRNDKEAPATLASAVYALMVRGRNGEAIDVLDRLDSLKSTGPDLAGVRAEALRLDHRPEAALESYTMALRHQPEKAWLLGGVASTLVALNRADDAAASITAAVESAPDDPDLLDLASEIALRTEDWDKAADLARRAIASDPHDVSAHYRLAFAARESGETLEALEVIRSARVLAPHNFDVLVMHGELALAAGFLEAATELFRQICADPTAPPAAHARLVWLLSATGQHSAGIAAAEAALERFGDTESVLVSLGQLFREIAPDKAIEPLRRAVAIPDHGSGATLALARALLESGDADGALTESEHAKVEAPESAEPFIIDAHAFAFAGRWTQARESAQTALRRDPESVEARVVLGRAALQAKDTDTAEDLLRKTVALDPTYAVARLYLAETLLESRPAEARELLDQIIDAREPIAAEALSLRARLHMNRGKLRRAVADLEAAAELAPDDDTILIDLADALRLRGDAARGLDVADLALDMRPNSPYAFAVRASANRALGRLDEARADLNRAIELDPHYGYAHILLAQLADDPKESQDHVDAARDLLPGSSRVEIEQANLYVKNQRYAEAVSTYERLLENTQEPDVLGAYIEGLRLAGRVEDAVQAGERALVEFGDDPTVRRNLAIALVQGGQREEGIAHLVQLEDAVGDANSKGDLGWALDANEEQDRALAMYDQALLAAPYDVWTLNQTSLLLSEVGDYAQSHAFAVRTCEVDPSSFEAWARVGWTAKQKDQPDFGLGARAFEKALDLLPEDDKDAWALAGLADCRQALGDPRAQDDFKQAFALAKHPVSKGAALLSTAGWCAYRLGDLTQAARLFLEASSLEDKPGSDVFDLALVTLCHGRSERARKLYADALSVIDAARHPLIRRGLIQVAIIDIHRANPDHRLDPAVTERILADLGRKLEDLPKAPMLASAPAVHT